MRGGEHTFLREQLPQMQEDKNKAEEDLRWNLQRLPPEMRNKHEQRLKEQLEKSKTARANYDRIKDAASPAEKKRMAVQTRRRAVSQIQGLDTSLGAKRKLTAKTNVNTREAEIEL
eukprot:SAG31_NODE_7229_length_1749_cov_1.341212_2_plen_115_part_01